MGYYGERWRGYKDAMATELLSPASSIHRPRPDTDIDYEYPAVPDPRSALVGLPPCKRRRGPRVYRAGAIRTVLFPVSRVLVAGVVWGRN